MDNAVEEEAALKCPKDNPWFFCSKCNAREDYETETEWDGPDTVLTTTPSEREWRDGTVTSHGNQSDTYS